jgi:hypothetical protein
LLPVSLVCFFVDTIWPYSGWLLPFLPHSTGRCESDLLHRSHAHHTSRVIQYPLTPEVALS